MKYFGGFIIVLLVISLSGCNCFNTLNVPFTLQFEDAKGDLTVTLNGTVVDKEGFNPRQGVNRVAVFKDSEVIWVGQWVSETGTIEEFLEEISLHEMLRVTSKGNRLVGLELVIDKGQT